MKKSNFFRAIFSFIASMFLPLYEAAEKKFTLGIITRTATAGTAAFSGAGSASQNINIKVSSNAPMIDRSNEPVIDPSAAPDYFPDSFEQTITSATGSGAVAVTAYFLNEDIYNTTPTTNGSAASSVTDTYNDFGGTGNGYNRMISGANGGKGAMCYGVTFVYQVTESGNNDPSGLAKSNVQLLNSTNVGNTQKPAPTPINQGLNYGMYQTGIMTILKKFYLCATSQIAYNVPVGDTVTIIALMRPQS